MKRLFANTVVCCIAMLYVENGYSQKALIDSLRKELAVKSSDSTEVYKLIRMSEAFKFYNPDSCLKYALLTQVVTERLKNAEWTFWTEVAIGEAYLVLGNYPKELACCYKAQKIAQQLNDPYVAGYVDGMLSNYYQNIGEYKTSLYYYRKVVRLAEEMYPDDISIVKANFSRIFYDMQEMDSALLYALKAYEGVRSNTHIHLREDNGAFEKSVISLALGNAYAGKTRYDSALLYYRRSIALSGYMDINMLDDYNGIAAVYHATGYQDSAIWYAQRARESELGKTYVVGLLKACATLADSYEAKQKSDSALKYTKLVAALKDSLWNRDKMNVIKNLTSVEQNKQNELVAAKSELQHRYTLYFLLAGFIMLVVTAGIIIRNRRQQQIQHIRNNIAADLHDDIGATLTSISILSELSSKSVHPENEASQFLTRLNQQVYATGQALDDIIRNVRVHNDSMEDILLRMRRFAAELFDADGLGYQLNFDERLAGLKIRMEQRHDFYLIFKEALNNIRKHANASLVKVDIVRDNNSIKMRIEDDGKGIHEPAPNRNGLSNMQTRAEKWGGHLQFKSGNAIGTVIILTLPVKK